MSTTSTRRTALILGLVAVASTLGACNQGVRHEASTRATYTLEADRIFSQELFANGPSLVAGDGLAMRMLVAGAYSPREDLNDQSIDTRFAEVSTTTD